MPKRRQLRGFDLRQIEGFTGLIGVDEAGRGAFAGPVVAAAVLIDRNFLDGPWVAAQAGRVNDSKLLTAAERDGLWLDFEKLAARGLMHAHFGSAGVDEIERYNILGATKLAMRSSRGTIPIFSPPSTTARNSGRPSPAACWSTGCRCAIFPIRTRPL